MTDVVRAPRYFVRRDDKPWKEALAHEFAMVEREAGLGLHGVIGPVTQGFTGVSRTGTLLRGRLVRDIYGIVGSRKLLHDGDMLRAQEIIEARLSYGTVGLRPDAVVSGGAPGIDRLATDIADALDIVTIVHRPKVWRWGVPGGFDDRNRKIVADANRLLCIRCTLSTTYGSGWTAELAEKQLGEDNVERIPL